MDRIKINCDSCERVWTRNCTLSFFEIQALESKPCPHCGAYTLTCGEGEEAVAAPKTCSWNSIR